MFASILRMCVSGLILPILLFLRLSYGEQIAYCEPSACGNIRNISFPFRLRDDPQHCGDFNYELVCENNTTSLNYYPHHKYRVESINYQNYTIRLSDPSFTTGNSCSFPSQNGLESSQSQYPFTFRYYLDRETLLARPATFLSCPHPANQSAYVAAGLCIDADSISRHRYVKLGHSEASEIGDQCRIDLVVMTSVPLKEYNNISFLQIRSSLLYGFDVSWFNALCGQKCTGKYDTCEWDGNRPVCKRNVYCFLGSINEPAECGGTRILLSSVLAWVRIVTTSYILIILAAKHVIGLPILLGLLIYKLRTRHRSMFDVIENFLQHQNNGLVTIRYSYPEIKKMTTGFKEKLGQGGYGSVYKGKLRSGRYVAVKVLSGGKSETNGQDFINEVATIGRIHHVNVVRLVGYCAERSKRALVYEFMPNGSLDKYILKQETENALSWEKKYEVAVGVARGIEYLHRGCDIQILHFDIKPHNILLDENFIPKISDFGLAKFYSTENNTVALTAARGTIGYVAPEVINRGIGGVSHKTDVYSFGMLLMEMVGLNRNLVTNGDESSQYFPHWIYNHLDKKDIEAGIHDADDKTTRKMGIVALWCIQMSPCDRPSMSKVIEMLESEVESLQIPPQPVYSEPQAVSQDWETDTTDSIAFLCEDKSRISSWSETC